MDKTPKSKTTQRKTQLGGLPTKAEGALVPTKKVTGLTDKLGDATLIGNYENGSPEWHELRKTGIGGSDIAAIVNASPWTSPFALWARKTGRIDDSFVPSEAAEWGNRLESVVIDKFEESHPELKIHRNAGTWANVDRPWQLANPDAIYEIPGKGFGIIEVKTSRYEDDWANGVPAYYATQVQWYLQTFGLSHAYVVALFAGSKYREYEIHADNFEQAVNLERVDMFRTYVLNDIQPDFDGATSTYETVRDLNPDIDPDIDDVELGDLGIHYVNATADFSAAEQKLNELKSRVLDAMGKAKRGLIYDKWAVTRQARNGGKPYLVNKKG
jgi:putative phage-type endonuclease